MKTLLIAFFLFSSALALGSTKPKLIVVISIDQFRADYLQKLSHHFLPATSGKKFGGFKYLMEKGAYFSHAQYGLLQNMTGPGHATILTGSFAYQNGIPNNDWYDQETQQFMYCTEDQSKKTIGANPSNPHVGTSPKNLIGTTFGDELKNAFPESRVISLALKDRSAILLGGHRSDLTLWFDQESFQWVSSEYYVPSKELPEWIKNFNLDLKNNTGSAQFWDRKITKKESDNKFVPETKYVKDMGLSFPHANKIGGAGTLLFPLGVEMPLEVAKLVVANSELGHKAATDLLAISLSSHDYVGHNFGPESDEIIETTVLEDKALSEFFTFLNKTIPGGLASTWIVLTADHGVGGNAAVLNSLKIPAGAVDQASINLALENFLMKKYGKGSAKWMNDPSELNFYLNRKVVSEKELSLDNVRDELARFIRNQSKLLNGVQEIFSGSDIRRRTLPAGLFEKQILRTYFEGRSGDIMMIPRPNYSIPYGASTHMSGYSYDRFVPMIFTGKPFKKGRFAGGEVIDIAPTLSFLMGIIPPTSSEGKVLSEALAK